MSYNCLVCAAGLLLSSFFVQAQSPYLYHFTVDDGLPSSFIYRTFQDSKGYIWACSDMGVVRYDGYSFETFTTQQGLPHNEVWDFTEDSKGRLWLHTYMPYFVYYDYADNKIHTRKFYKDGTSHLLAFHEWQGDVWASLNAKIVVNTRTGEEQVLPHYVMGLNGRTSRSLWSINQETIQDERNKQIIAVLQKNLGKAYEKNTVKNMFDECWNNEQCFIYTIQDTIYYDSPTDCFAKSLYELVNTPDDHIVRIDIVSDNKLLLVTAQKVIILNEKLEKMNEFNFIENYNVNSVLEDKEKNLWICTKNNGLYMLTHAALSNRLFSIKHHTQDYPLKIQSIAADQQGRIWLATSEGFIYYFHNNAIHNLPIDQAFWGSIRQLFVTPQNLLLAVCNNYLLFIPLADEITTHPFQIVKTSLPPLPLNTPVQIKRPTPNQIVCMHAAVKKITAGNNQLLLSGSQLIIQLKVTDSAMQMQTVCGTLRNYALAENNKYDIFVGTPTGLKVLRHQDLSIESFGDMGSQNTHLSYYISDMAWDKFNNLWVATNGGGLYYLSPEQQSQLLAHNNEQNLYTPISEISSTSIKSLFVDPQNNIWASSNQGVYRLIPSAEEKPTVHHYSTTQGLPTNETFAVYADQQTAYIATNSGLALLGNYDTCSNNKNIANPPLYFTHFKVNKKDYSPQHGKLIGSFTYQENNIDIGFVCLSYQSKQQINYHYRTIKNGDLQAATWQNTTQLQREFPLLPPAHYQFEVKATDIDGTESNIASLSFIIDPPWWQQNWFRASVLIAMLCLLWVAYQLRIRYVRNQEQARNEFAALRLQALQSQMNPHFMNNALNAIQLFIAHEDSFSANEYLAKFADLNRLYLEASRRRFVPLAEELQLLETYLELEHLRFPNRFKHHIDVSPQLVSEMLLFPAMLLQPLAENAINHGILYLKNKEGCLKISIFKQNDDIVCLIDDNGVGRKASNEIKAKRKKNYPSRGMQIIEELQKNINMLNILEIDTAITDKIDEQGQAQGTLIKITLRYANSK